MGLKEIIKLFIIAFLFEIWFDFRIIANEKEFEDSKIVKYIFSPATTLILLSALYLICIKWF